MLTLFRKIRKSLIESSSVRKYLLYAIGEIALVVIGILIALQVNNWNERKRAIALGQDYLIKLEKDLSDDLLYLDSLRIVYNEWNEQATYILDTVLSGEYKRLKGINEYTVGRTSMNFLNINESTYGEMFSGGERVIYQNQQLVFLIKSYYQNAEVELEKLNSDNDKILSWV